MDLWSFPRGTREDFSHTRQNCTNIEMYFSGSMVIDRLPNVRVRLALHANHPHTYFGGRRRFQSGRGSLARVVFSFHPSTWDSASELGQRPFCAQTRHPHIREESRTEVVIQLVTSWQQSSFECDWTGNGTRLWPGIRPGNGCRSTRVRTPSICQSTAERRLDLVINSLRRKWFPHLPYPRLRACVK